MTETGMWLIGGGGAFIITLITFWMTLATRITEAQNAGKNAVEKSESASLLATSSLAKYEFLARDLGKMEVETSSKIAALAASTEATARSLVAAETRLAKAVDDVAKSMDHLSDTIIKTLGDLARQQLK